MRVATLVKRSYVENILAVIFTLILIMIINSKTVSSVGCIMCFDKKTDLCDGGVEEELNSLINVMSIFQHNKQWYSVNKDKQTLTLKSTMNRKNITDIVIPPSIEVGGKGYPVTIIGKSALEGCENLINVRIPNSVVSIKKKSFARCKNLSTMEIPDSVVTIEDKSFEGCDKLKNINIGKHLKTIGKCVFHNCYKLERIRFFCNPNFNVVDSVVYRNKMSSIVYCCKKDIKNLDLFESILSIESCAFEGCYNLFGVHITDKIISIGKYAFYNSSITNVTIEKSVKIIEKKAFYNCRSLNKFFVSDQNSNFKSKDGVLFNKDMSVLISYPPANNSRCYIIPNSVRTIENAAFGFSGMKVILMQNNVININKNCFYYCAMLETINLSKNIKVVPDNCFKACMCLKQVVVGDDVKYIGKKAFYDCTNLEKVSLGRGVRYIGEFAFCYCDCLKNIVLSKLNPYIVVKDGVIFDICGFNLIACTRDKSGEYSVPRSVISIMSGAFSNSKITDLVIPSGLKYIGEKAFACSNIEKVSIPDSVLVLGSHAFEYCDSLRKVEIGRGITSIQNGTFTSCYNLETVNLSDNIFSIGDWAFYNCNNLKNIVISKNVVYIGEGSFFNCFNNNNILKQSDNLFVGQGAFYKNNFTKH